MTPDEQRHHQQKIRGAAQQDISDIDALAKNDPFNRYFVGQINRLFQDEREMALTAKLPEDRDRARHRAVLLRELTQMPAKHRESAEKLLMTPLPQDRGPVQVG